MELKTIAKNIYLGFSDEEWNHVNKEFKILEEELEVLNQIDTDGVEPMDLPFTLNENSLRMDDQGEVLAAEDVVLNAADKQDNMVKIVKVVG